MAPLLADPSKRPGLLVAEVLGCMGGAVVQDRRRPCPVRQGSVVEVVISPYWQFWGHRARPAAAA